MKALILLTLAAGLALVWRWHEARRFTLARRLAPALGRATVRSGGLTQALGLIRDDALGKVGLLGSGTLADRLARAGDRGGVTAHRARQVGWAAAGMAAGLVVGVAGLFLGGSPAGGVGLMIVGAVAGAVGPDLALSARARRRSQRIRAQLPVLAELLALAVVAGESVTAAMARLASTAGGELAQELGDVVAQTRAGVSLESALDGLAERTKEPALAAFASTIVTSVERGTPLAEVLHVQAAEVRDQSRQALMEEGGKREIAMLIPVVLLILPVTIVFALYPGLVALRLGP